MRYKLRYCKCHIPKEEARKAKEISIVIQVTRGLGLSRHVVLGLLVELLTELIDSVKLMYSFSTRSAPPEWAVECRIYAPRIND
jgi:hypothetical protein